MQMTLRGIFTDVQLTFPVHHFIRIAQFSPYLRILAAVMLLIQLIGCVGPLRQRVLYERGDIQIGLQTDLTTERASPPAPNSHPHTISREEMRTLLESVEVSGWSGIILGLFETPKPFPVFTTAELDVITEPIAHAFELAGPNERVFFSIPGNKPAYPYQKEKTVGALFFRDHYLHMVLTNHYAFPPTDPGGGEERDPRDTKGMKLWVGAPARPASVPKEKEPEWSAFEKVHISLSPKEVLAARAVTPSLPEAAKSVSSTSSPQTAPPKARTSVADEGTMRGQSFDDDLRLQVRELTNANLDLRSRLKEQSAEVETLRLELDRLRKEIKSGSPQRPSSRTSPAPPTR